MPLNLTNTIRLVNILPNLKNFIFVSKLNTKMNAIFIFLKITVQSYPSLSCLHLHLCCFLLWCTLPSHFSSCPLSMILSPPPPLLVALLTSSHLRVLTTAHFSASLPSAKRVAQCLQTGAGYFNFLFGMLNSLLFTSSLSPFSSPSCLGRILPRQEFRPSSTSATA